MTTESEVCMMTKIKPIKCASKYFKTSPFYLIQFSGTDKRFLASFCDKEMIKKFLHLFIDNSVLDLQIRICESDNCESRFDVESQINKSKIKDILDKFENFIFHDGYHDLMIRRPETGDYVVFDEHGLIFIYTNDDYSNILEQLGLTYKPYAKVICQYDHWHFRAANGPQDLINLINEFGLTGEE
jgi:hypothetical protein